LCPFPQQTILVLPLTVRVHECSCVENGNLDRKITFAPYQGKILDPAGLPGMGFKRGGKRMNLLFFYDSGIQWLKCSTRKALPGNEHTKRVARGHTIQRK